MKNLNLLVLSLLSIMLFSSCDQLEDIFLGGENNEITESSGLYYVQNETEGMDMITDNVDHILFIETDPATQERTIKGGRMDTKSEKCVEEEVFESLTVHNVVTGINNSVDILTCLDAFECFIKVLVAC